MPGFTKRVAMAVLLFGGAVPELSPLVPEPTLDPDPPSPQLVVERVARRYRIGDIAAERTVNAAYGAAYEAGLDPLLVLAVIGVESSFNPAAESGAGAKGLMQIIPAWHRARLDEYGGEAEVFDPAINIAVGTRILAEFIKRAGDLEAGLQYYNGASADPSSRYARKVFAERELIRQTYE